MTEMKWHTSMVYARDTSWAENKPILLDFFNPESTGCKKMDTVTYPNEKVVTFIDDHYVPLRLDHDKIPFSMDYTLIWTPSLRVLDRDGRELQRSTGYMEPDELIPYLMLGYSMFKLIFNHHDLAKRYLETIIADYPQSAVAPESLYFLGVNQYISKKDPKELRKAYEGLMEKYPDSIWAQKASPYKHL